MRRDLLRRLEALEVQLGDDESMPLAIFMVVNDMSTRGNGERLEVLGWKEGMVSNPEAFMRLPGESEDACGERAARTVRARPGRDPLSVPVLTAITELRGMDDET